MEAAAVLAIGLILSQPQELAEPAGPWALCDCVAYALEHSPRLAAEGHRVAAAEYTIREAESGDDLRVGLQGSVALQGPEVAIRIPGAQPVVIKPPTQGSLSLQLTLPLDVSRQWRHARLSARLTAGAQRDRYRQALQQLILDTTTAYYGVLSAQSALAAAESALRVAEGEVALASARREAGAATEAQVAAADSLRAAAAGRVAEAEGRLADERAHLAAVLGLEVSQTPDVVDAELELDTSLDWELARDLALAERPELRALQATAEALEASAEAVRRSLSPTLSLGAGATLETPTGFSPGEAYRATLTFTWPLSDGGVANAASRRVRRTREAVLEDLADTRLLVERQVRAAYTQLAVLDERIAADHAEVTRTERALAEAGARFAEGAATRQELARAEQALNQARATMRMHCYERSVARAEWARALGVLDRLMLPEVAADLAVEASP